MITIKAKHTQFIDVEIHEMDLLAAVERYLLGSVELWQGDWLDKSDNTVRRNMSYDSKHLVRVATEEDIHIFTIVSEIKKVYYRKPRSE